MSNGLSDGTLYCCDIIRLVSGEILSVHGSFDKPWCRARLSFFPHKEANRFIDGIAYQKARYETGYLISGCEKLLDLPGEQQFLVHQSQINKVFRSSQAFVGLSQKDLEQCSAFIGILHDVCHLSKDRHGLTGSGALHNILPVSDFDWVVYDRDPAIFEQCILTHDCFKRELTFNMEHVYRKYQVFTGLSREDLNNLFKDRWKYFRFGGLHISLNFVDPLMRADDFLNPNLLQERIALEGMVTDDAGCYQLPRIIPLHCSGKDYLVLTWLFLYNGAFKKGELVACSGRRCVIQDKEYVLVEKPEDYIRKLAPGGESNVCSG